MKCKYCSKDMELISVADSPNDDYAFNVFLCGNCDTLCHNSVWDNAGNIWIKPNTQIEHEVD